MKIIQVINAMIANHHKITNVLRSAKEYYFMYDSKYKWSIAKGDGKDEYYLHFYPTNEMTLEQLAVFEEWQSFSGYITYKTSELKTQEALESFSELHQIVSGKVFGLDEIFDNIINN